MREMLVRWFKMAVDPRPTWEAVVTALRSPSVDAQHLAEQLESKYCTLILAESNNPITSKTEKSKGTYFSSWSTFQAYSCVFIQFWKPRSSVFQWSIPVIL